MSKYSYKISSRSKSENAHADALSQGTQECLKRVADRELKSDGIPDCNHFGAAAVATQEAGEEPKLTQILSCLKDDKLVEEFSNVADFLLVYIDEAHPSDGWAAPGVGSYEVKKHRNQEDRCAAANKLLEKYSLPPQCQVVADCMDNNANVAYGVSFERVCIVQRQKIVYLGGKGPFFYNLHEVQQWLEQTFGDRRLNG
ncbi:unnamed protein product [Ranitomeya imitator]|uniref:Iodothyronine deiodinase n=1 Tax=Ranitomeya imitator TaxID=111125 RepID=A0ABN9L9N8_9NEOB|nr:unnamed protein product [Ranitomeya imitator]